MTDDQGYGDLGFNGNEIINATNKVILKGATKVAVNFVEIKLPFTNES